MTLLTKLHSLNLSEVAGMNLLQDFGIVSDNAVYVADVCESDQVRAIEFFNEKLTHGQ